ncbi:hypothetical protein FH972_022817 [Carpinus fangiana]|uniref:HPP transmembrane region domain-containing protein n=1 Tax=Carpinus fangiana TaxID=176857 RepID=A0A5N6KTD5_9ROSI|nr:hypothetical protein FH972_022817 [Carpinus fangiana]
MGDSTGSTLYSLVQLPRRAERAFLSLHFDIEKYLSPLIPKSRVDRLPRCVNHFLGHRDAPKKPIGNVAVAAWAAFGGFVGTAILSGFFMSDFIQSHGGPIIVGSYGAAAILEYNAIESPFSQPRNALVGQFTAALVGTCVTKLFAMNSNFENLRWIAGSLSVGIASALMTLTGTVHPPAGATALLAAVDSHVSGLGWLYLPIVIISSLLTIAVACLLNNIHRQYPLYWWSPTKQIPSSPGKDEEKCQDSSVTHHETEDHIQRHWDREVVVSVEGAKMPYNFFISPEELALLKRLEGRLRQTQLRTSEEDHSDAFSGTHRSDDDKASL